MKSKLINLLVSTRQTHK